MTHGTVRALVFDFDGLLMDTETTLWQSWQYEWRQHGLELDPAGFFADHGGDVSDQRFGALAAAVGPGFDRAASQARRTAYREELHRTLDLAPGIREWFARAAERGLRLAVASSSVREWVCGNLDRAGALDRIDVLACGDEVDAHKPDPAVYLLALRRLGLDPAHALAFEDTPHGVAAAHAAGLRCVAIPNAFTPVTRYGAAELVLAGAAGSSLDEVIRRATGGPSVPAGR